MTGDDEEFTELVDPNIETMHAVAAAANGTRILFAKSAGEAAGVFSPDYVRDLIAKGAEGEEPAPEEVRLTPAQAMALVHAATVRKAAMSAADVNDLPDSAFAHIEPGGEKDDQGKTTPRSLRHYPVHDQAHARDALGRAQAQIQDGDGDAKRIARAALPKIRAAAARFGVKVAKADGTPGSPQWESADASAATSLVDRILALLPDVQALAEREQAEADGGDVAGACDVAGVADQLMGAARLLGAFAVSERAEAGEPVTKAQDAPTPSAAPATPTPQESTVTSTTDGAQPGAETTATPAVEAVVKAEETGLSEAEYARLGRMFLAKEAAKASTETPGAVAPDARVVPGTQTVQSPPQADDQEVAKAAANSFATALEKVMAPVVEQLGELAAKVKSQDERVEKMAAQPDDRRSPMLNGATGTAGLALRGAGPTHSPEFAAVMKAIAELPEGPGRDEAKQAVGIAAIKARFAPS